MRFVKVNRFAVHLCRSGKSGRQPVYESERIVLRKQMQPRAGPRVRLGRPDVPQHLLPQSGDVQVRRAISVLF